MESAKAHTRAILEGLPEDSTIDDIIRELAFSKMVDRGLADSEAGRVISHEEMGRRIKTWRK